MLQIVCLEFLTVNNKSTSLTYYQGPRQVFKNACLKQQSQLIFDIKMKVPQEFSFAHSAPAGKINHFVLRQPRVLHSMFFAC